MSLSLLHRAEQALEDGDPEATLALVNQVLTEEPQDIDALELKGLAQIELGQIEAAESTFEILLKLEPAHVTALIAAADAKIREAQGDVARIESGLALLSKAEPLAQGEETLLIEVHLLRGIALSHLGEFDDALEAFSQVLSLDPEHGEAQLEGALCAFEQGRFDEAQRGFQGLIEAFPQEPWSFHYLGLIAERRGLDAKSWFDKANRLDPEEFPAPTPLSVLEFEESVAEAIDRLPSYTRPHLENTVITVKPFPSDEEVEAGLSPTVLGVFEGVPLDERLDTVSEHHQTAHITLFQKNLERFARDRAELLHEIEITVLHEVGHLLGLDEHELDERGLG